LLTEKNVDINAKSISYETPLLYAISNNNTEICNLLIAKGCDINATTNDDVWSPLLRATNCNNTEICRLLIENGADVNMTKKDGYGYTPLFYAIDRNNTEICRLLLLKGADATSIVDRDHNDTPLMVATRRRNYEVCRLLIALGADINAKNKRGESPLSYSVKKSDVGMVCLLLFHLILSYKFLLIYIAVIIATAALYVK